MNTIMKKPLLLSAAASLLLAGCSLAPTYERPDAPIPSQYPATAGAQADFASVDPARVAAADLGWREFFRDPYLKALIDIALRNNRDIRIAASRVREAQSQFGIQQSELIPDFGLGANAQIQRNPESVRVGGSGAPAVSRFYQVGIGMAAYELDFFGRIRNLSRAAYEQYLATDEARRTVHINLIAQLAQAYFSLRGAEEQRLLMQKTLKARQQTYSLVKTRFDAGIASALDLNQAQGQLDTIRSDLAAIERARAQAGNALQLLVGQEIPTGLPKPAPFGRNQLVSSVPAGLPSDLIVRRPDIIGAEHQLQAENANIGAARAAFFPNITITGLLGFASSAMGGLFDASNRAWQFTPQLTVPLFSGGVAGNYDLAKGRKITAIAQYEKTIQTAFREVADALAGEATYANQLDALRSLEKSAVATLDIARLRYENGIDSFLQVQTAEVDLYTAQRLFLQTGLESLANRVELYKALGGGWYENNRS